MGIILPWLFHCRSIQKHTFLWIKEGKVVLTMSDHFRCCTGMLYWMNVLQINTNKHWAQKKCFALLERNSRFLKCADNLKFICDPLVQSRGVFKHSSKANWTNFNQLLTYPLIIAKPVFCWISQCVCLKVNTVVDLHYCLLCLELAVSQSACEQKIWLFRTFIVTLLFHNDFNWIFNRKSRADNLVIFKPHKRSPGTDKGAQAEHFQRTHQHFTRDQ